MCSRSHENRTDDPNIAHGVSGAARYDRSDESGGSDGSVDEGSTRLMRGLRDLFGTRDCPFPAWLELRHPRLARWRENAPYLVFRTRRMDHRGRLLVRLRETALVRMMFRGGALLLLVPILGVAAAFNCFLSAALFVVAAIAIMHIGRLTAAAGPSCLPSKLIALFGEPKRHHQAIIDFYLMGFSGKEIAEGVFLEAIEEDMRAIRLLFPLVALLILSLFCIPEMQSVSGVVLVLGLIALLPFVFLTIIDIRVRNVPFGRVDRLYGWWQGHAEAEDDLIGFAVVMISLGLGAIFCFGALSGISFVLATLGQVFYHLSSPEMGAHIRRVWPILSFVMLLVFAERMLWCYRTRILPRTNQRVEEQFERSTELYQKYMHDKHLEGAPG